MSLYACLCGKEQEDGSMCESCSKTIEPLELPPKLPWEGSSDDIEKWARQIREEIPKTVRSLSGYEGYEIIAELPGNIYLSGTLVESEEAKIEMIDDELGLIQVDLSRFMKNGNGPVKVRLVNHEEDVSVSIELKGQP